MSKLRSKLLTLVGYLTIFVMLASGVHAEQPNFLIIMADDCTFNDLPMYGGQNAKTPHLTQLASESLVFNRAYLSEAMCQPCRAELFTGLYPMSNGCAWNHSASHDNTQSLPHYLGPLGYRVGLAGKVHVKPARAFPFEKVNGFEKNCVRNPTRPHELEGIKEFMGQNEEPFCLVVALVEPHVPWVMGDASAYPADKLKLPPNIADTPRTRTDFAKYLAEITYMDSQVGDILETLEATGKSDNTMVLFTSEQGSQFPGCKWTNWDTGVHTALMARLPNWVKPGRTDAIIQYTDVLPTLIEMAGGNLEPGTSDGTSFVNVLQGSKQTHREYAFGCHNNIPEGPSYPVRTVTDGSFRYLRNLKPNEIYIEKHLMGSKGMGELNNPYWGTWVFDSATNERTYELIKRYTRRPAKELYHTSEDPYEMNNLIDDPKYTSIKQRLSQKLDLWLQQEGDPGSPQDSKEAHQAAKQGEHLYLPPGDKK